MTIAQVKISDLVQYENNPRKNDHAVDRLAVAISEFGFRVPVITSEDGAVIDGHLRIKAAESLGMETVPVVTVDDLTPEQVRAFRISVNRMAEIAEWDYDKLQDELEFLSDKGFDLSLTGIEDLSFLDDVEWEDPDDGGGGESTTARITVSVEEDDYNDLKRDIAKVAQKYRAKVI